MKGKWLKDAYDAELEWIGDFSAKPDPVTEDWGKTQIGEAEAAVASKVAIQTARTNDVETAKRWKVVAGEEATAADEDLTRANNLLASLVDEIAPLARKEFTVRKELDDLAAKEAARVVAARELGVAFAEG